MGTWMSTVDIKKSLHLVSQQTRGLHAGDGEFRGLHTNAKSMVCKEQSPVQQGKEKYLRIFDGSQHVIQYVYGEIPPFFQIGLIYRLNV